MRLLTLTCSLAAVLAAADAAPPTPPLPAGPPPGVGMGGPGGEVRSAGGPEALFALADADGDGKVSLADWQGAVEAQRKTEADKRFDGMDADHNGSISREEFAKVGQGPAQEGRGKMIEARFKRMDGDGDGVVTVAELQAMREKERAARARQPGGEGPGGKKGPPGMGPPPMGPPPMGPPPAPAAPPAAETEKAP